MVAGKRLLVLVFGSGRRLGPMSASSVAGGVAIGRRGGGRCVEKPWPRRDIVTTAWILVDGTIREMEGSGWRVSGLEKGIYRFYLLPQSISSEPVSVQLLGQVSGGWRRKVLSRK